MARTRLREHRRLERRNADRSEVVGCRFLTSRRSIIFALVLALSLPLALGDEGEKGGGEKEGLKEKEETMERDGQGAEASRRNTCANWGATGPQTDGQNRWAVTPGFFASSSRGPKGAPL